MILATTRRFHPRRRRQSASPFVLPEPERLRHLWVIGKTGAGKSTLLRNMIAQDISHGAGFAVFDPHGDLAEDILPLIPPKRRGDVLYVDPADRAFPLGFNVLETVPVDERPLVAASVVQAFQHLWSYSWGPQLEQILYNAVAAQLDVPDGTLLGVQYMLMSVSYRKRVVSFIQDPEVRSFWERDFESWSAKEKHERTLSTRNKLGQFTADPVVRNIIGQPRSAIDLSDILSGKILIVNLSQSKLGFRKAQLLGSLLTTKLHTEALKREERTPFHLYYDEFHHFGAGAFIDMLSGIRKFGVSLTLAHQYLDQLTPELRSAVMGTVGTMVAFKIGTRDAKLLASEFGLKEGELTDLERFKVRVTSSGRGADLSVTPTNARTYPASARKIIAASRHRTRAREDVERDITRFIQSK